MLIKLFIQVAEKRDRKKVGVLVRRRGVFILRGKPVYEQVISFRIEDLRNSRRDLVLEVRPNSCCIASVWQTVTCSQTNPFLTGAWPSRPAIAK
jgi:hypothetical protein